MAQSIAAAIHGLISQRSHTLNAPSAPGLVGQPILRVEDQRLLTGAGRYVADGHYAGLAHLVVIRSEHPHADLRAIDVDAARTMPGVLGVFTGRDLAADGVSGIPWELRPPVAPGTPPESLPPLGDPSIAPPQPVLAVDRVRYQGEPIAIVVADSPARALDAAEHVHIDYAPRPAVFAGRKAVRPDTVRLWDQFPGNVCFRVRGGDAARATAAFERAAHVTRLSIDIPRLVQNPIETRSYVGEFDAASGRYTLHAAAGKPQTIGRAIANDCLHVPTDRVRVIAKDVGGGFGAKNTLYAESVLVLWAAKRVGRPVRWIASRGEAFLSDMQARDQSFDAELAFDAEGHILGLRVRAITNLGAYLGQRGVTPPTLMTRTITSMYRVPTFDHEGLAVHTNTVPTCPYRGAGAPESMMVIERMIDLAARELGIAPEMLRRRNLIPVDAMPYRASSGSVYDSGDFAAAMDAAVARADVTGFAARRAASERAGRLRGLGYGNMMEACGHGISEKAVVSASPDGVVTIRIGSMSNGQSHETVYAQILADKLGVPMSRIRVVQGDSLETPDGWGTGASRSMTVGGSALVFAGDKLIEAGRPIAAQLLEAAASEIDYERGNYRVIGTDRIVGLERVATQAIAAGARPDRGLEAEHRHEPKDATYPNGCHIAEVEIDPETGVVQLLRYTMAQDVGRALNPMVIEGQLAGGVTQGVGEALFERTHLDAESGQVLTGSFLDYPMPRADDLPSFDTTILEVPCKNTPNGVKSCGEAGATAAPATVQNAIADALWPLGVRSIPIPATPESILKAIAAARSPEVEA